ncbi:MAG: hypothetical protein ACRDMZ_06665, partial [Solirubrobacteraceae bacterium]
MILARDGRVSGRQKSGDKLELEVRVPTRPTPFEVVLDPPNTEWQCGCDSKEAVCSHVVAGVLSALASAGRTGDALPAGDSARGLASIRYLISPAPGGVFVDRLL